MICWMIRNWIRGLALPFVSSIFKGIVVVYIKDMGDEIPDTKCKDIYCEVCRHNIRKLGWTKHLKTKKHIENEKGVEEVEKKQCRKCGCWRVLELYRGENATCNICLGYRESWAKKNEEKVRVMNKNYWAQHREEKKVYNKEYSSNGHTAITKGIQKYLISEKKCGPKNGSDLECEKNVKKM